MSDIKVSKFDVQQLLSEFTKVKFQTKTATGITSDGVEASLTFNNLEIGKRYRVYGRLFSDGATGNQGAMVHLLHDGNNLEQPANIGGIYALTDNDRRNSYAFDETFVASASTLEADFFNVSNSGNNFKWTLEELPNHEEVTDWT